MNKRTWSTYLMLHNSDVTTGKYTNSIANHKYSISCCNGLWQKRLNKNPQTKNWMQSNNMVLLKGSRMRLQDIVYLLRLHDIMKRVLLQPLDQRMNDTYHYHWTHCNGIILGRWFVKYCCDSRLHNKPHAKHRGSLSGRSCTSSLRNRNIFTGMYS
jgi:hypothetical protein